MSRTERWPYAPDLKGRAEKFAKSYDRLLREADEMIQQAPMMDGQPRGTRTGDPTAAAVIRRERITRELGIITGALLEIEPEYRAGIIENVCRGVPMYKLDGACVNTWSSKKRVFLMAIVERAGWADPVSEWRSY